MLKFADSSYKHVQRFPTMPPRYDKYSCLVGMVLASLQTHLPDSADQARRQGLVV